MVLKISGFDSICRLVSIRFYKGQESHFQDGLSPSCHIFLWLSLLELVHLPSLKWFLVSLSNLSLFLVTVSWVYLWTSGLLWICWVTCSCHDNWSSLLDRTMVLDRTIHPWFYLPQSHTWHRSMTKLYSGLPKPGACGPRYAYWSSLIDLSISSFQKGWTYGLFKSPCLLLQCSNRLKNI